MPRTKQEVHVYYENGSKHSTYKSETDFSVAFDLPLNYLSKKRKPRFNENIVRIHETDLYASNEPVGRTRIKNYIRKLNSKFIKLKELDDKTINCYNLDNELIASFNSLFHLRALLGQNVTVHKTKPKHPRGELYFISNNN